MQTGKPVLRSSSLAVLVGRSFPRRVNRFKSLPLFVVLVLAIGVLFSGCNTVVRPDSVNVSVANLKATSLTATETQMTMTLRFTSESLNAFGFAGSSHKLYLNGGYVGRAVSKTPVGLPPLSTTTQDITLIIENGALMRQLASGGAIVKYRLESVLYTQTGDDETKTKSSFDGTIDLRGL